VAASKPASSPAPTPASTKKEAPVVVAAPVAVVEATESSVQTREERHKAFLASVDSQLAVLKALRAQAVANFKADNSDFKSAAKSGRRRRATASSGQENAVKVA
jgi:uncharacterized protein (DUF2345 family)